VTTQDIRGAMRSDQWNTLQSRNAQTPFLAEFAERQCDIPHPHSSRKSAKEAKTPHCPFSLTDDQEKAIREMVRERAIAGTYVAQKEVLNFVETEFRKTLTHGWLECFLKRQSRDIRKTVLAP
jgi:hypothetical protein